MWPNSPATPYFPRCSSPPIMMLPPMPVPRFTQMMLSSPCPAPNRHSAHRAAFASFSTTTGRRSRWWIASRSGSLRQDRCGANSTVARAASTKPAAPMPTAAMS